MKKIETKNAPKAIGPYSQAIVANGFVYTSGQLGIDPSTGVLDLEIENQAKQAFLNIKGILEEANSSLDKVIKTTVFVTDGAYFGVVNQIYESYFVSKPARSFVVVKSLPKDAKIEIEVIALA